MDARTIARWAEHPITRYVREANPGMDLADQLAEQLKVMEALEERFPHLTFSEIFETAAGRSVRTESRRILRKGLRAAGVDEEVIGDLVPRGGTGTGRASSRRLANYHELRSWARKYEEHRAAGGERAAFAKAHGLSTTYTSRIIQMVLPLTQERWETGLQALQEGASWEELAKEAGVSKQTLAMWACAVRYQLERDGLEVA